MPAHKCKRCWRNTRTTVDTLRDSLSLCSCCYSKYVSAQKPIEVQFAQPGDIRAFPSGARYMCTAAGTPGTWLLLSENEPKPTQYPTLLTTSDLSGRIASLQRTLDELAE